MILDIIFVTYKRREDVEEALSELLRYSNGCRLIFTGREAPASVNRNVGLAQAQSDIVIMIDDDMAGFYDGWTDDLVAPLLSNPEIVLTSARLLNPDGSLGPCLGANGLATSGVVEAKKFGSGWYRLPTACVAIRKAAAAIKFDEGFIGSGYEDTDWMNRLTAAFPDKKMILNNDCKLVHYHQAKKQGGTYFAHNKARYLAKWPDDTAVQRDTDWTLYEH